ncbi:MAG: class I SAM-dependent methyltransferase [Bacteroidetes bacterium]|nr:class I SAM-dependent methyltransferase [Bacteroidota bacterium]
MATIRHKKYIGYSTLLFIGLIVVAYVINTIIFKGEIFILMAFGLAILFLTILITARNLQDIIIEKKNETVAISDGWNLFYATYPLQLHLPLITSFTIAPDFAFILIKTIQTRKPKTILELGCGRTTLIAAAYLKQNGLQGKIISVDGDKEYLEQCRYFATLNGLESYIQFVHAPITEQVINKKTYNWYNADMLPKEQFDLLLIDGPPEKVGVLSRYPALPLLIQYAAEHAVILADDAGRPDMIITAQHWQKEFPKFQQQYIQTLRGTLIINVDV